MTALRAVRADRVVRPYEAVIGGVPCGTSRTPSPTDGSRRRTGCTSRRIDDGRPETHPATAERFFVLPMASRRRRIGYTSRRVDDGTAETHSATAERFFVLPMASRRRRTGCTSRRVDDAGRKRIPPRRRDFSSCRWQADDGVSGIRRGGLMIAGRKRSRRQARLNIFSI